MRDAGTDEVNGEYKRSPPEPGYDPVFRSKAGHCLVHAPTSIYDCPVGWYITTTQGPDGFGMYFHESTDATRIPATDWQIYQGEYSTPGADPAPRITVRSAFSIQCARTNFAVLVLSIQSAFR